MTDVIQLSQTGGPDVLRLVSANLPQPEANEVVVKQTAIGVNYLDVTQRRGDVPIKLPGGIGLEAAGTISAKGAAVSELEVGDTVVYALGPIGAYASERTYPADRLIKLPDNLSAEQAASVFFKGLTAQYLIKSTYAVTNGSTVLLYGAAGGVGQLLASWAQHLGATVIGVVSRVESVERAKHAGCAEVLVWGESDLVESVSHITGGRMADVVFDGIGRLTFETSLKSLRTRGTMVSIGASSGVPDPVPLAALNAKSLFLTRPGLGAHITDLAEYKERARDVFDALAAKIIVPATATVFPLAEASKAHSAIESGAASGPVVLVP